MSFIPGNVAHLLANFLCMVVMNFLGISFSQLTWERGMLFGAGTYHFVYIALPALMVLVKVLKLPARAKALESKTAEKK